MEHSLAPFLRGWPEFKMGKLKLPAIYSRYKFDIDKILEEQSEALAEAKVAKRKAAAREAYLRKWDRVPEKQSKPFPYRERPKGIVGAKELVLGAMQPGGRYRCADMVKALGRPMGTVAPMLSRLCAAGYVDRVAARQPVKGFLRGKLQPVSLYGLTARGVARRELALERIKKAAQVRAALEGEAWFQ
jgi:hypothetical protein